MVGCSRVAIHDKTIYVDEGPQGAYYTHVLTSQTGSVSKAVWDQERVGMLCMSAQDWGYLKTEEEQLCAESQGECDVQMQTNIMRSFRRIDLALRHRNKSAIDQTK